MFFENDKEIEVAHSVAATSGDTEVVLLIKFKVNDTNFWGVRWYNVMY